MTTDLQIRSIPFEFDASTPFQWNPANPRFGLLCNTVSLFAPPFEKYIVSATREAMKRIDDPAVLAEADAFVKQEALHASVHKRHLAALIAQHPGLQRTLDEMTALYDDLYAAEPLEFHLAYIADVEATFTPLFGLFLDHRGLLFEGGDSRVASLFLWHFAEEIEHRSSAFIVYNAVVPSRTFRLRMIPKVARHLEQLGRVAARGINEHVPLEHRLVDAGRGTTRSRPGEPAPPALFAGVPRRAKLRMLARLLLSQLPWHDPKDEPLPPFAAEWARAYDEGRDVTDWYRAASSR